MPRHRTINLQAPAFIGNLGPAAIDVGIAELIIECWDAGIATDRCCQESGPGMAWISFSTPEHMQAFQAAVSDDCLTWQEFEQLAKAANWDDYPEGDDGLVKWQDENIGDRWSATDIADSWLWHERDVLFPASRIEWAVRQLRSASSEEGRDEPIGADNSH
jgi:hypothetical protein